MDFVNLLLFCLMSCVIGAVVMLLIQYYAFVRYFRLPELDQEEENQRKSAFSERYVLPDVSVGVPVSPSCCCYGSVQFPFCSVFFFRFFAQFLFCFPSCLARA
uniref:Uncharacterized protein n=1 Tax=Anopheles melas TaxID=34690 RepID=A0A182TIR1_9DIPT